MKTSTILIIGSSIIVAGVVGYIIYKRSKKGQTAATMPPVHPGPGTVLATPPPVITPSISTGASYTLPPIIAPTSGTTSVMPTTTGTPISPTTFTPISTAKVAAPPTIATLNPNPLPSIGPVMGTPLIQSTAKVQAPIVAPTFTTLSATGTVATINPNLLPVFDAVAPQDNPQLLSLILSN